MSRAYYGPHNLGPLNCRACLHPMPRALLNQGLRLHPTCGLTEEDY